MLIAVVLMAALWSAGPAEAAQNEPTAPRSTTERPNMSAPGMEQTLSGVMMDATCSAIADSRSELTRTPRILPPRDSSGLPSRSTERSATERPAAPESAVPDTYRDCRLKASTTSFAIYTNGRVYMLDRVSNQMMQEHMLKAKDVSSGRWMTRTLVGTATSDNVLTLRAVRK